MNKYCMIETTFDDKKEADQVINELLNNKLIASCQVVESDSKWRWKDELEKSKEFLVFLKTKKELSIEIFETIKKYHSYECFEFAIFEIDSCNDEYLNWIDKETK